MARIGVVCLVAVASACGGESATRGHPVAPVRVEPLTEPEPPPASEPTEVETTRMDLEVMDRIVREVAPDATRQGGLWELTYEGVQLAIITDARADRMRIVSPVIEEAQMTEQQRRAVMEANFHSALDARYATSRGVLYAAFIHPLTPLGKDELRSALRQVATLAQTFGTSYSSGDLVFGL